jgi:hypothetical protein
MATCRGCKARIRWVVFTKYKEGKKIYQPAPVDWEPNPMGNLVLRFEGSKTIATALGTEAGRREAREKGIDLYMPHHVTCPRVDDFGRERRGPVLFIALLLFLMGSAAAALM